ncbi:hypothetical protein [Xenorhabdus hominickii]|uniref:Uncharacterized protein n=1 Tax=Xenorhabdus hominickii TaxID=351679 RepID=A0A2G0QA49_XENHO|nr:hypothetical protein [Xenorhabdus hominickii]AOM40922.1 hypothetical protein A9255_10225 [Xenorhabdus hominickii]PHM56104.1 hypothetical protein Xhom_01575 [Xenorhabdus hominickii]
MSDFDKNTIFVFGMNSERVDYFKHFQLSLLNTNNKDNNIYVILDSLNNTLKLAPLEDYGDKPFQNVRNIHSFVQKKISTNISQNQIDMFKVLSNEYSNDKNMICKMRWPDTILNSWLSFSYDNFEKNHFTMVL